MPLYPKNADKNLDPQLFKDPTCEYRGAPFWAWNCKLDKDLLLREIEYMKEMGLGGFHMHSRTGLDTKYLSDEFMEMVKACDQKAKDENMLAWLYDEDRWPSGAAGGYVTKNVAYRARYMLFTYRKRTECEASKDEFFQRIKEGKKPVGYFISAYSVLLSGGFLKDYKRLENIDDKGISGGKTWYAYICTDPESSWYNNQSYVDTLNPDAINEFIKITHERYYEVLGDEFGKSVPAIFTDEPKFQHKTSLGFAGEENEICLSYTDDFDSSYKDTYGDNILDFIPELVWQLPENKISVARYRYHDHVCERFVRGFSDNIGRWCEKHNLMLTGHVLDESSLGSQTGAVGEAMRSYRGFQLPGIDILCDGREFSTAKQAQSAVRQFGRDGVLSELYGVTNWDFDFKGHKLQGDWQAAMGITVRVHHLTWASMEGDAKRDYPACIGYQSPWYKEYKMIEDHFARVNTAMTRGKPVVKVGVIHPIESYWLHFGPREQTQTVRDQLENNFSSIINWLQFGLIDFDFISESLLPELCESIVSPSFNVGKMNYDVIIVPGNDTLRGTTLDRLEAFEKIGGRIIFMGNPPRYVDAIESDKAKKLYEKCKKIEFSKNPLYETLSNVREIEIRTDSGALSSNLFYQMRQDGEGRFLFISHVNKGDMHYSNWKGSYVESEENEKLVIKIKGNWVVKLYDTMTGDISDLGSYVKDGFTYIKRIVYHWDSLLLYLVPAQVVSEGTRAEYERSISKAAAKKSFITLPNPVNITLSEPNALLLDIAEYRIDGGEWQTAEELLKICEITKRKLGFAHDSTQPWAVEEVEKYNNKLDLKFTVHVKIPVKNACLAIERPERTVIYVNGEKIENNITGFYTDESIKTIPIPELYKGDNIILTEIDFGRKSNVEWCYILGDFGVNVSGRHSVITESVRKLYFGDYVTQGLPFYGGNVTYNIPIATKAGKMYIKVPKFKNPVIGVSVDGKKLQSIAVPPYTVFAGDVAEGGHTVELTSYGNRVNTFGTVHLNNEHLTWFGPDAWLTTGDAFVYEYQLKKTGILVTPKIWLE